MTSTINLEGKTLSSTIAKLSAPLPQAFNPRLSSESDASIAPTPTYNTQVQRLADFETLTAALEYAASGTAGYNFYDAKGNLRSVLPYHALRENARTSAQRLSVLGLARGERVAIIADTSPEFVELFFACRYAGLIPYAMPVPVNLGSHAVYV
jgi:fatty-acyl-CoA synthase